MILKISRKQKRRNSRRSHSITKPREPIPHPCALWSIRQNRAADTNKKTNILIVEGTAIFGETTLCSHIVRAIAARHSNNTSTTFWISFLF